jgi:hypothetical protein
MKYLQRLFFLLVAIVFLFPNATLAIQNQPFSLAKNNTEYLLGITRKTLSQELLARISNPNNADPNVGGAMATIQRAIFEGQLYYYFREIPLEVGKIFAMQAAKMGYYLITSDLSSFFMDTLENLSVEKAKSTAINWLTENQIKTSGGELNFSYSSYRGNEEAITIPYILTYYPLDNDYAKIAIEFYSREAIEPPGTRLHSTWQCQAWQNRGYQELRPFVLSIQGKVKILSRAYRWVDSPQIKVEFPDVVPAVTIKDPLSLTERVFAYSVGWIKDKYHALFSPLPEDSPKVIQENSASTNTNLQELKNSVELLRRTVEEKQSNPVRLELSPDLDSSLSSFVKGMLIIGENMGITSEENREVNQEIAKITQYQSEIARWQAEQDKENSSADLEDGEESTVEEDNSETSTEKTNESSEELSLCSTINLPQPDWNKVIFNEVAWMGDKESPNNEWIELKNKTKGKINLTGWQLFNQNKNLIVLFDEDDSILANNFFLLERTDDNTIPTKSADKIYQGGLKNSSETLYLFDVNCSLQDLIWADPQWPAGDNISKRTMERKNNLTWQTSSLSSGTPKSSNSVGYDPTEETDKEESSENNSSTNANQNNSSQTDTAAPKANAGPDQTISFNQSFTLNAHLSGDNIAIVSYKWDTNDDGFWNETKEDSSISFVAQYFNPGAHSITLQVADEAGNTDEDEVIIVVEEIPSLLISEIKIEGENKKDEFVELYNPNQESVNLSQWSLSKKTSGGKESCLVSASTLSGDLAPLSYFLIVPQGDTNYQGKTSPDSYYSGSTYSIATDYTILLYNPAEILSDKIGFGQASDAEGAPFPTNPGPEQSLGRKWSQENESYQDSDNNQTDFELQVPTPGNINGTSFDVTPPLTPTISLSDPETNSHDYTNKQTVNVSVAENDDVAAWFLAEDQASPPPSTSLQWQSNLPTNFTLSESDGEKILFLWVKDAPGNIGQDHQTASIILDATPPVTIADLYAAPGEESGQIILSWHTPADAHGLDKYQIKKYFSPVTNNNWEEGLDVTPSNLIPQQTGHPEQITLTNLDPQEDHWFAIKSWDQVDNESALSNTVYSQAFPHQGTAEDPYVLANCEELQMIKNHLNSYYKIVGDIDCSSTITWDDGQGFTPIGDSTNYFTGHIDGQDYCIQNLFINRINDQDENIGMFGIIGALAEIKNLCLENCQISGYSLVGGLAGKVHGGVNSSAEISNCEISGSIYGKAEGGVGGLIGSASNVTINRCRVAANVSNDSNFKQHNNQGSAGGLIGNARNNVIISDSSSGSISQETLIIGDWGVGGLVGRLDGESLIENCFSHNNNISGNQFVGGFVGENRAEIKNCYAHNKVKGEKSVGGFVGWEEYRGVNRDLFIVNSYTTSYTTKASDSSSLIGGFAGYRTNGYDSHCFWDIGATGQSQSDGYAKGQTTIGMKQKSTFTTDVWQGTINVDWDFENIWNIDEQTNSGYPFLRSNLPS